MSDKEKVNNSKSTQVKEKPKGKEDSKKKIDLPRACPWLCNQMPTNVPAPGPTQTVLHPHKDVFVLKVAKIGANGDRRCKMELELVTPKGPEKKVPDRVDTRGTQCLPDPCCCCSKPPKKN